MIKSIGLIFFFLIGGFLCFPEAHAQSSDLETNPYSSKWEVYAHGGWGYRISRISEQVPSDLRDYAKTLLSGYSASAGFTRYIHRRFGPGLRYSRFGSNGSLRNVTATDLETGEIRQGTMQDHLAIQLIAPTFNFRSANPSGPFRLALFVGAGYIDYRYNSKLADFNSKISGANLGVTMGTNVGWALNSNLTLAAGASLVSGVLNEFTINLDGNNRVQTLESEKENLLNVQTTLGLHWQWGKR